ncbi:MAG TPA: hypothetical protein VJ725_23370 [Thermoanaerobaculia bacterium]|nr:hypothetical protein [Thermoanaerobaculia bacterium]
MSDPRLKILRVIPWALLIATLSPTIAWAQRCTGEQIQKMIDAGFSREEILRLCAGESQPVPRPPSALSEPSPSVSRAPVGSCERWFTDTNKRFTEKAGKIRGTPPGTDPTSPTYPEMLQVAQQWAALAAEQQKDPIPEQVKEANDLLVTYYSGMGRNQEQMAQYLATGNFWALDEGANALIEAMQAQSQLRLKLEIAAAACGLDVRKYVPEALWGPLMPPSM